MLLVSAAGYLLFAAGYYRRDILDGWTAAFLAVFAFGFPWMGARIGEWVVPRLRARQFARKCLPGYATTTVRADAAGVDLRWTDSGAQLGWATFLCAVEADEFFLLYQSEKSSIYLPKRALSPEQLVQLQVLIQEHLGHKGGLTSRAAA